MLGQGYGYKPGAGADDFYYDGFREKCIATECKFILRPRRCYLTNRRLWLEYAYKQTALWTGPGEPLFEYRWYDKTEFLIAKLKNTV